MLVLLGKKKKKINKSTHQRIFSILKVKDKPGLLMFSFSLSLERASPPAFIPLTLSFLPSVAWDVRTLSSCPPAVSCVKGSGHIGVLVHVCLVNVVIVESSFHFSCRR